MSTHIRNCAFAAIPLAWLTVIATLSAQTARPPAPFLGDSLAGKDSFEAYCASCHGPAGRGDGPVAPSLKNIPADLSALTRRNGNSFPRERVTAVLMGTSRPIAAHGTSAMPIWGPMFRMFETDARATVRIEHLVSYLQTLQVTQQQPTDMGKDLFRVYCAVCHGVDARGGGPLTTELRRLPPSLMSYAIRNGGVFPSEQLRTIIDGRGVSAHGNREMPVWGDAFRRTRDGLTDEDARLRIDAIVKYLATIQERATF